MALPLPSPFIFARYLTSVTATHKLSQSDAEPLTMQQVLDMADPASKALWDSLVLGYTSSNGRLDLREEVARLHGVEPDHVNIVVSEEGIYIASNCLVHHLKRLYGLFHAVVGFPAYQSLYEHLKVHECDLSYWTASWTDNGWVFDIEELRGLLRDDTRLLVVNFPHNPTGFLPTASMWAELLQLCQQRGIYVFSDEIYNLTNNDGSEPILSACEVYENSVSLCGMSKTFGVTGLRLSWVCTRNKELYDMMARFKDYLTVCPAAPSELLALMILRRFEIFRQRTLTIVQHNLNLLDEFFSRHTELFQWRRPRAGRTAFVKLQGKLLQVGSSGGTSLCKALLDQKNLMVLNGKFYGFSDDYIRVGFGRKGLEETLRVFEEFITEIK